MVLQIYKYGKNAVNLYGHSLIQIDNIVNGRN